jgi:hypothetical protein
MEESPNDEPIEHVTVETETLETEQDPFSEIGEEEHLELFYTFYHVKFGNPTITPFCF